MKAKVIGARALAVLLVVTLLGLPLATLAAQGNATVLTVGYIGAASGRQAAIDQNLYQAAVLAAEQINTSDDYGVVSDDNVRYRFDVVYYAANSAEDAADAYRNALIDGAIAVLGPEQTRLLDAIAGDDGPDLPVLVADAGDLAGEDNVFQLSSSTEAWIQAAADYLVDERHFTQIATVAVDTESAQNGADLFAVLAGDSNLALSITHAADADDLSSEAQDIVDARADALFVWTLDATGVLLLQELEALGWQGAVVYVGLDQTVIDAVGSELAANLIGLNPWSPAAYDAYSERFVSDYESRWGEAPAEHAAAYYDALTLLAEAVQAAGDSPALIASALEDDSAIEGVQGAYVGASTDALHLIQTDADGATTDLAFYEGGACLSCADITLPALTDDETEDMQPYHIALISTLAGVNAAAGNAAQQGAELAIREIETQGGVMGADGVAYDLRLGAYELDQHARRAGGLRGRPRRRCPGHPGAGFERPGVR